MSASTDQGTDTKSSPWRAAAPATGPAATASRGGSVTEAPEHDDHGARRRPEPTTTFPSGLGRDHRAAGARTGRVRDRQDVLRADVLRALRLDAAAVRRGRPDPRPEGVLLAR